MKRLASAVLMVVTVIGFIAVSSVSATASPGPKDQLKATTDQVLGMLQNKQLAEEEKARRVREAIRPRFDFDEMSKRVLATHYRANANRMNEFVPLFTELLEKLYFSKVLMAEGASVIYLSEKVDGNMADVRTKITFAKGDDAEVSYRMHLVNGEWKIYDIMAGGTSLVGNYRSQFNTIIRRSSFDQLLKDIRDTVDGKKK